MAATIPTTLNISNRVAGDQHNTYNFYYKIFYDENLKAQLLQWLKKLALGLDYESRHFGACEQYVQGSCQWFVRDQRFSNWVAGSTKTLVCLGSPGAGKTVIVSFIIEHLRSQFEHTPDVCVAYIYCDYKQQTKQTLLSLLAILLEQFVLKLAGLCPQAEAFFKQYRERHVTHSTLLEVVRDVVRQFRCVFITVDALDEWSSYDSDARQLYQMLGGLGSNVSLLITARLDYSRLFHLDDSSFLPIRARDDDIKLYAKKIFKSLTGLLDEKHMDSILQNIVSLSGGIFLLAKLSLELAKQWEIKQFAGSCVPRSIDRFYRRIMRRITTEGYIHLAREILFWVVYSMRPLYVQELQHTISLSQNLGQFTIDENFRSTVIKVCAGLVVVDQVNALRFIHFTAQQYVEKYLDRSANAHADIVRVCLKHISHCARSLLADDVLDQETPSETYLRVHGVLDSFRYPFLLYAAHTWGFHAQRHESQVLENLILFLADKAHVRLTSLLLFPPERAGAFNQSPLHIVAYFDLPIIAQRLIDDGLDVDSTDSNDRTPLSLAAERGSIGVLETLLANEADVNKADKSGDTALAWAARCKQDKIVERLGVVQSVQLDSRNTSGSTPLCVAANSGHVEIVVMLLRLAANRATLVKGQDTPLYSSTRDSITSVKNPLLETSTANGQTALMLAAWNGHVNVVNALLQAGANVNARDNMGFTPISQAAERGEERVVEILLDNKADANTKDAEGNTPLAKVSMLRLKYIPRGAAAMDGRMNILMRLLRFPDIQVDSQNCSGNTPLIYAAGCHGVPRNNLFHQGGHQHEILFNDVTKALLDHGANVNTRNLDGHTPISQAASHGYFEIVKTLLAHGANVDVRDEAGVTPLLSAVRGRHVSVVEELLKKVDKCCIDHEDRNGFTALGHAARIGHDGLVCLLLRAGAKVNFDKFERNPLSLAARGGHEQVVKSLLLHGADVGHQSGRLTTPLHLAVVRGHKGVVAALLDKCSTHSAINAKNSKDRTPLIYAALQGHREILRTLLGCGADVNARDCEGRSALSYAAAGGHHTLTKILLKHKEVEVNRQDNHTKIPFWHAVRWGHVKVLRELIDSCSHVEPFLALARKFGYHKNVTYLFAVQLRREVEFEYLCDELFREVRYQLHTTVPTAPSSYTQAGHEPQQTNSFYNQIDPNPSGLWNPGPFMTPLPWPVPQFAAPTSTSPFEPFSTTMRTTDTPETTAVQSGFHSIDVGSFPATTEPFTQPQHTPVSATSPAMAGSSSTSLVIQQPQAVSSTKTTQLSNGHVARGRMPNRSTSTGTASAGEPHSTVQPPYSPLASNPSLKLWRPGSSTGLLPASQQLQPPIRSNTPKAGSSATSIAAQKPQTARLLPHISPSNIAHPSYAQVTRSLSRICTSSAANARKPFPNI